MNGSTRKQIQKLKDEEKFPAKEIRIMNLHFLLHLSGLLPPDNATPIMRVLHKIFLTGIFTLNILALSGQMMAVYVHWGDIPLIATIMSHLTGLLLTIIACLYFLYNKNKFMALVELLRMEFVNKMKSKYMGFVVVAERRVKMAALLAAPIATSLAILWVIAPFLNGDESDNFENNNATNGDKNVKGLMFVMWTPFDIQESPRFEIIIALQFIVVSLPIIMIFSVDAIFVSLMSHAAAQFKLLCAMLNDMHENIAESEFHRTEERASPMHVSTDNSSVKETLTSARGNIPHEYPSGSEEHSGSPSSEIARPGDDHVDEDPIRLYLVECIKYHVAIIEFVDRFNGIVSLSTFLKVLNFPFLLCMTGFQMMQNVTNYEEFLKFASLFACSLFLIAAYAWFGQQVIDESEKVQLAFYSTDWYIQTPDFKSLLPVAIMRASRPVTVTAGVFFDMSLLTLASLVNASYRYFTLLIQLHES